MEDEKCKTCKYCKKLNVQQRLIINPNMNGIISKLIISKSNIKYEKSCVCIAHNEMCKTGIYTETSPNDVCELYERGISHVYKRK